MQKRLYSYFRKGRLYIIILKGLLIYRKLHILGLFANKIQNDPFFKTSPEKFNFGTKNATFGYFRSKTLNLGLKTHYLNVF